MAKEDEMNIDYEKLRKKLVAREVVNGLIVGTHAKVGDCVNAYEATPEQLISIARRYNVKLDKFKIK